MAKNCICKKSMTVNVHDDDGCYTEESMTINEGDKFQISESDFRLIGGDVRLDSDDAWLELSRAKFDQHFDVVEEEQP